MKTALVTGASAGIGREAAIELANAGYLVYASGRRKERLEELSHFGIRSLPFDLTKDKEIRTAVDQFFKENEQLDLLVNNAGFGLYGAVGDVPLQDAREQFEVNFFGLAYLTKLVIPKMQNARSGRIINVSSVVGKIYLPFGAWYCATKHALEGWSDALRFELKPFGIDIVIIEPGLVKTEFSDISRSKFSEYFENSMYKEKFTSVMQNKEKLSAVQGSPATLLGKEILRAATASRPKTRYAKGRFAKLVLFARKNFGDRFFDWAIKVFLG